MTARFEADRSTESVPFDDHMVVRSRNIRPID